MKNKKIKFVKNKKIKFIMGIDSMIKNLFFYVSN